MIMEKLRRVAPALHLAFFATLFGANLSSARAADYYAGKTISFLVGGNPGGGYDVYVRAIARHLPKHIPGAPQIIVRNQPGAGSGAAAATIFATAPKDGTWIGALFPGVIIGPILDPKSRVTFVPTKFHYVASADSGTRVCITGEKSKIKTMKDAIENRTIMGASAAGGSSRDYAYMLVHTTGAKFDVVSGYKGTVDIFVAMERGELDGVCGLDWTSLKAQRPQWVRDKTANILVQTGLRPDAELTALGVPSAFDFISKDEDRKAIELIVSQQVFGRPYVLAPETPADAIKILRTAFMSVFSDKAFLADATRSRIDINPTSGEDVQRLVTRIFATPKDVIDRAKRIIVQ